METLYSSKKSLKYVLFHNGNLFGAIPTGHSVHLKEKRKHLKVVLDLLKYDDNNKWVICVDRKMVNFLLGQQSIHVSYAYRIAEQKTNIGNRNSGQSEKV